MKITSIRRQVKRQGRYSIYVDEKYAFSLSDSGLLDLKIYVGQEITAKQLQDYNDSSKIDKAYGLTLAYVARRLRSEWELKEYFRRKNIDDNAGSVIIDRLRHFGYVDDFAFARSWMDNRRTVRPVSKRRLSQELRQKHVSDDVIRQILDEDNIPDLQTLRQLVNKKRSQSRYQDPTKLMQYLARQGYNYDDIKQVVSSGQDYEN